MSETPKPDDTEGHIYVVEFSTGVVKPGKTIRPETRLIEHRMAAERFGVRIARSWVSPLHKGVSSNEKTLLRWCAEHGGKQRPSKSEYYTGVSYEALLVIAEQLPFAEPIGSAAQRKRVASAMERAFTSRLVHFQPAA